MYTLRQKVFLWALYTRILIITIQFFANLCLNQTEAAKREHEEHNVNKSSFQWVQVEPFNKNESHVDSLEASDVIYLLFGGLVPSNDEESQHNLHIASNGYTYESNLDYFPFYPLLIKTVASSFTWLFSANGGVTNPSTFILSSVIVNTLLFALAADRLYLLSRIVLRDEYLAYKSALFFCVSPSSVLFVAPLTLSLLSVTSFASMISIERGMGLTTGVFLALAVASHPSGLSVLLMVLHYSMRHVATQTILYVKQKRKNKQEGSGNPINNQLFEACFTVGLSALLPGVWCIMAATSPFAAFQWFGFTAFCKLKSSELSTFPIQIEEYGNLRNMTMPGSDVKPDWCDLSPPIPLYHMTMKAIESRDVLEQDWLSYVASLPAFVLVMWQLSIFVKVHKRYCLRLGLVDNSLLGMAMPKTLSWVVSRALPRNAFIFLVHAFSLIASSIYLGSVQSVGRILVASDPTLYWIAALITTSSDKEAMPVLAKHQNAFPDGKDAENISVTVESGRNLRSAVSTLVLSEVSNSELANWTKIYFFGYLSLGTVIFASNFSGPL